MIIARLQVCVSNECERLRSYTEQIAKSKFQNVLTFLVELPETVSLSSTDGFLLDDGRIIAIKAKPESLLKIKHSNLPRIAWHVGNRHTPCQVGHDHLLIQEDHVMEGLLHLLGADIEKLHAPFIPEGGAYGLGRTHSHSHNLSHQSSTKIDSSDDTFNGKA